MSAEGRSRAYAGGHSVPVSLLTYLADDLVAVHGQADQQQLLRPGRQREALDRFAGPALAAAAADYQRAYQRHREIRAELAELTSLARERAQEADDLRRGLAEIERLEPVEGEDVELRAEEDRLANADALHSAATMAHDALLGDPSSGSYDLPDAVSLLGAASQALEAVASHDPALAGLAARLSEASYLVSDAGAELASYLQSVEADPARLAAVQERRAELTRLIRGVRASRPGPSRPGPSRPGPGRAGRAGRPGWRRPRRRRGQRRRGSGPGQPGRRRPGRGARLGQAGRGPAGRAGRGRRPDRRAGRRGGPAGRGDGHPGGPAHRAAHRGGRAVRGRGDRRAGRAGHAARPGHGGGHRRRTEFGPHGADDVEIRLAAHPGAPALPLAKGASGGELSRVMLAIEVVFAGADPVPTFVFDEVDAGVGGKAAVEIGRRLARLARLAQVIVVTHLPQVAAFADTHLVVEKAGRRQRHAQRGDPAGRRGPGHRAVPDAGRPGGLRVRPGARRGAARRRGRGTGRGRPRERHGRG